MRGVYDANIKISGLSSARTLMLITAPATAVVKILSAKVTDASNATNQQLECCWQLVSSLGSPTSTGITPAKHERGDQAAASTVVGNVTASEPTYTANTNLDQGGFPSLAGWQHAPIEEERIIIAPGATYGLRLLSPSTPTSQDTDVVVKFQEIG